MVDKIRITKVVCNGELLDVVLFQVARGERRSH